MVDLLLVTPPSRLLVYQNLSENLAAIEPPVWSGLIAQSMRLKGLHVAMLDAEAEGLNHVQTAHRIIATNALLTAFVIYGQQPSASTQCIPAGRTVAEALTRASFGGATIVIGTHVSALPERTLHEEPYRYVCEGEGPRTIFHLIEHLKGKSEIEDVPGLWYRQHDRLCHNAPAPLIEDLDAELPRQAWDLLDMTRYRAHNWHCFDNPASRPHYASLQTSLGCPFKCSFCCINTPFGRSTIRYWSVGNVLSQVDTLVNTYGVRNIKIPDEMFVLNPTRVASICDGLIERGYKLNIWAYARIDTLNDVTMLHKLKSAGFNWLGIGIESASKYVRDGSVKGRFGNADIRNTIRRVRDAGIYVAANYIFGLPDDTEQSMSETLALAKELNTEWANFYSAMAYPGSPLYSLAKTAGLPLPDDIDGPGWIGYSQHAFDCRPLPTGTLTGQQVLDFRDAAFHDYFTNPDYSALMNNQFGAAVVQEIRHMLSHDLPRHHRTRLLP
jgi:anaerobic magnesium-protoporphyrin IX monomethyl ester cyclase